MARRRKGQPIHGWVVLDKPTGLGSTQALSRVKRILQPQKAGHAGTLDPMATGILPIALGEATKLVSYVMDAPKTYTFTVRWGAATDTDDADGDVIETSDVRPDRAAIEAALSAFVGLIMQVPPAYAAVKVDGVRAYDLARHGEAVDLPPRAVEIHELALTDQPSRDEACFAVTCGKGTYVRAIARDLGQRLGCLGHVSALRRTACGPFAENRSITLEKLQSLGHKDMPPTDCHAPGVLPLEDALDDIPALTVTEAEASQLCMGQALSVLPLLSRMPEDVEPGDVLCVLHARRLIAMATLDQGKIRSLRVMHYAS